jgi:hypothetical protein
MHLSTDDLEFMGRDLLRALLVYSEAYIPDDIPAITRLLESTRLFSNGSKNVADIDRKKLYSHHTRI